MFDAVSNLRKPMDRPLRSGANHSLTASQADPDIIASLDRWTTASQAKLYSSTV